MLSRTDTTGPTNFLKFYPVMDHWGESESALARGIFEPPTYRSTVNQANHQTTMTAPSQKINYTPGPQRGDLLSIGRGGGVVCENGPTTCRPSPGWLIIYIIFINIILLILISYVCRYTYLFSKSSLSRIYFLC